MQVSPFSPWLYRTARRGVILLAIALVPALLTAQLGRIQKPKGPRALGLLTFAPNGKALLIPVAILVDGKFYDAGAYKASPVPMALEPQTVYEGLRTGVSQGLFTITGVLQSKDAWLAEGSWLAAGAAPAKTKHEAESKPNMGENDAPPTLRRGAAKPAGDATPENQAPENPAQTPASTSASTPAPTSAPTASVPASPPAAPPATPPPPAPEDKDHPVLHRGKPTQTTAAEDFPPATSKGTTGKKTEPASNAVAPAASTTTPQLMAAISDADGPDPRPYAYSMKPDEEQVFRKKMLALAADELRKRAREIGAMAAEPSTTQTAPRSRKPAFKAPQPTLDDVQLRVFDLSSANEPVLVLTVTARMPFAGRSTETIPADLQYFLTLVTRNDIYGELHKVYASVTDTRHLDAIPRLELIDAVDADGNGRGELLFRTLSDAGSAYSVYRVVGDQIYPLFEGTPQ